MMGFEGMSFEQVLDRMNDMHVYFGARDKHLGRPRKKPENQYVMGM